MELERWAELSAAVSAVAVGWKRRPKDRHSTALIVRVHLWAASFDRPTSWACEPGNWRAATRPHALPDASWLYDYCHGHGHQLVCPRPRPGTGFGHGYHSPHRHRAVEMLESPARVNDFGATLYAQRTDVEREFSGMVCFGGGLAAL